MRENYLPKHRATGTGRAQWRRSQPQSALARRARSIIAIVVPVVLVLASVASAAARSTAAAPAHHVTSWWTPGAERPSDQPGG